MTIMGLTCIVQRRCSDRQQTAQDRDEKRQEIHLWTHHGFWKDLTYLGRNGVHIDAASRYLEETLSIMPNAKPGNDSLQELYLICLNKWQTPRSDSKFGHCHVLTVCYQLVNKRIQKTACFQWFVVQAIWIFCILQSICLSLDIKPTATLNFIVSNYISFTRSMHIHLSMYINLPFSKNNLLLIYTRVTKKYEDFCHNCVA